MRFSRSYLIHFNIARLVQWTSGKKNVDIWTRFFCHFELLQRNENACFIVRPSKCRWTKSSIVFGIAEKPKRIKRNGIYVSFHVKSSYFHFNWTERIHFGKNKAEMKRNEGKREKREINWIINCLCVCCHCRQFIKNHSTQTDDTISSHSLPLLS